MFVLYKNININLYKNRNKCAIAQLFNTLNPSPEYQFKTV